MDVPLQIDDAPVIIGAGVALIVAINVVVPLQAPFDDTNVTEPVVPVPHTILTVEAVEEPLMVPPTTVQLYVVAAEPLYVNVPPLHTLLEPLMLALGVAITETLKALLVTEQPVDTIVSFTVTELAPAPDHNTVIEFVPWPEMIVPAPVSVQLKPRPPLLIVEYVAVPPLHTEIEPVTIGVGNAVTFTA